MLVGLSSFVNNPSESSEHVVVLLQYAAALVPKVKHAETPVYIMATAGLRLLDARWVPNISFSFSVFIFQ